MQVDCKIEWRPLLDSTWPVLMPAKLDIFNDELIYADVWMNFASLADADVPKMTSGKVVL